VQTTVFIVSSARVTILGLMYESNKKDLGLQGPNISMYDAGWFSVLENNQLCSVTTISFIQRRTVTNR
jgi:hypothetical protein